MDSSKMRYFCSPLKSAGCALAAALLIAGCAKNQPESLQTVPEPERAKTPLQIDLQLNQGADTKAVKTGWEAGDMVMVFFPGLSDTNKDKYLTVVYTVNEETGNPEWLPSLQSEAPAVEDLEASGPMTALFLPYGKGTVANWDATESHYVLSRTDYAYFLRAENATYTVEEGVLKGTLNMHIPGGYIQFFLPITPEDPADPEAYHDEGAWYTLRQDYLIPTAASSIAADGTVLTEQLPAGDPIDGFDYADGYQFSGILTSGADGASQHYWFTLKNNSLGRNFYLFRPDKTFTGGKAAKFPAAASWQEAGPDKWVDIGEGTEWASCNLNATFPTEAGSYHYRFDPVGPSRADFTSLMDGTDKYSMSVHGTNGMVFKSKSNDNAIFLPYAGYYSGKVQNTNVGVRGYYCCSDVEPNGEGMMSVETHYYVIIPGDIYMMCFDESDSGSGQRYTVRHCRTSPTLP